MNPLDMRPSTGPASSSRPERQFQFPTRSSSRLANHDQPVRLPPPRLELKPSTVQSGLFDVAMPMSS
ncbi:unnamed protein product [Protopolystoma xenopodis]|uniref:Uncharacterized protein n=1 Tax=Protopolystoma xenopodis TaxID=117903 RepID=A0A3S5B6E3_9PLAT|nr:unnamed protein product [Protopolystoma xenopodis]